MRRLIAGSNRGALDLPRPQMGFRGQAMQTGIGPFDCLLVGGAGGVIQAEGFMLPPGVYSGTIGAGDPGGPSITRTRGGDTSALFWQAFGGGNGGKAGAGAFGGADGGCGGGAQLGVTVFGRGIVGQGYDGGEAVPGVVGGGGGGAGGRGSGENGGPGVVSDITGASVEYGRGGNTGPNSSDPSPGRGFSAGAGTAGGNGGFVLRYPTGKARVTGGTVTTSGPYTIHTFDTPGAFDFTVWRVSK
jgi:hypothetical protein